MPPTVSSNRVVYNPKNPRLPTRAHFGKRAAVAEGTLWQAMAGELLLARRDLCPCGYATDY